ncbi:MULTISPECIES: WhiB family transcriptional regulator [unclassified Janibacter]|uniref:WhiB family transcriptional regulator n=1 Tax=unclassified Janibacter TaxID=2649294 RepID=UPI003D06BF07
MPLITLLDQQERDYAEGASVPCRVEDPELWFADTPADVEFAKALCATCPVRDACLASALDRAEPWGVWGGELFDHGVVIPRKRPRGRPRKHPIPA